MNFHWSMFVELGIIAAALLIGTFFRAKVRFFQKFLIPNSITAGVILLLFYSLLGPLLKMNRSFLENLVYHLLNISFVAMSLRTPRMKMVVGSEKYPMSVAIISQYMLQGVLGMVLTLIFIKTVFPGLFPGFGFFIPMGFCLGPGQAFAIGSKWEAPAFGFTGAGSVGLTFAAAGFFWAIFGGMFLINLGVRKGWIRLSDHNTHGSIGANRSGLRKKDDDFPVGAQLTTYSEAIEAFALNLSVVLLVYLFTFLFLKLLTFVLAFIGPAGKDLAESFWGLAFIFAALFGMIARRILPLFKIEHLMEPGILNRTAGFSVDFMVAASIGAISIPIVIQYWIPILTMVVIGGVAVSVSLLWFSSRILTNYRFERMIIMYGSMTGTLPSGLTLLRVVDPEFETPAANDYIAASAIAFPIAIPYVLMADFPAYGYRDGNPLFYWLTAAILFAYLLYTVIAFLVLSKRAGSSLKGHIWRN